MDPGPIGVVAGSGVGGPGLEGAVVGMGRRGRGGFSGEREEEEDRSEAEEREKWEERDFLCVLLLSAGHLPNGGGSSSHHHFISSNVLGSNSK